MTEWLKNLWCKLFHGAHCWPDGMHRMAFKCMVCDREWAEPE